MSDYAKVNLREVEDSAVAYGVQGIEARFPKRQLGCTAGAVSLQRLEPGARSPWGHRHERQEELYVILSGGGTMNLDGELIDIGPWDAIRVAPGTMRAFEAGPDGLELLAYGAPLTEEQDAELVPGWWSE
jgi:mannose-6-phosphate isomerase-like protein (cupin superfamily)